MSETQASQRDIDVEMLRSMAAAISSGQSFSFHPDDMAECLLRAAEFVRPKLTIVRH